MENEETGVDKFFENLEKGKLTVSEQMVYSKILLSVNEGKRVSQGKQKNTETQVFLASHFKVKQPQQINSHLRKLRSLDTDKNPRIICSVGNVKYLFCIPDHNEYIRKAITEFDWYFETPKVHLSYVRKTLKLDKKFYDHVIEFIPRNQRK